MREPLGRMLSWFAYCDKYSPNKCNAGKSFAKKMSPGESRASRFYSVRKQLYDRAGGTEARVPKPPTGTFHPNHVEFTLDDNYQVRVRVWVRVWVLGAGDTSPVGGDLHFPIHAPSLPRSRMIRLNPWPRPRDLNLT